MPFAPTCSRRTGSPLATFHAEQNRRPITLDQVPQPVIDSVLAVEDADFYQHKGVNARAVVRALTQNVSAGAVLQGGSTITQQLVKNALLNSNRDIDRKSKEVVLAFRLEQQLSKDQILETYLNTVYFGAGAYGVQAAAETYWGVDAAKLGYAEGAMLAALISNPQSYDPTLHPDEALKQRELALQRLVAQNKITQDQATALGHTPLPVRRCGANDQNKPVSCGDVAVPQAQDYFTEEVKQELLDDPRLGATKAERFVAVFGGGLEDLHDARPGGPGRGPAGAGLHAAGQRQGHHRGHGRRRTVDRRGAGPRGWARLRQVPVRHRHRPRARHRSTSGARPGRRSRR